MPSTSARREASPITDSMWRSSASDTPMWRGMNSVGFSSSPSGRADCINMGFLERAGAGLARPPSTRWLPGRSREDRALRSGAGQAFALTNFW
jgi:hypothetical protein